MERLKAILADKILDISSGSGDEVKAKIDKIQRFRDFANACQTLMKKYPAIEDELIKMVGDGDFDTKVASSRVDTVIRLADAEAAQTGKIIITPQISEPVEIETPRAETVLEEDTEVPTRDEPDYQPEDVDYVELQSPEDDYVPYENMVAEEENEAGIDEAGEQALSDEERIARRKMIIKRVVQVLGIVLVVVAIIFIVKFVMTHWQAILIIAGVLAVLAILFFWFKRKR